MAYGVKDRTAPTPELIKALAFHEDVKRRTADRLKARAEQIEAVRQAVLASVNSRRNSGKKSTR